MATISDDELLEKALKGEVVETGEDTQQEPSVPQEEVSKSAAAQYLGTQLSHKPGDSPYADKEGDQKLINEKKLTRIGEKIGEHAEYREGWIDVDKSLLGERALFYPEDWEFKIRPATVEAIRNWSTVI